MGDLSFSNSKQNSNKRSCFPEIGLFHRQSVHFEIQKFAYFHERHVLFKLKKKRTPAGVLASLKLVYFHGRSAFFKFQKEL